ncbi:MAG: hypothetical protein AAB588_02405, partial [Patescibacteria group bacterium]
RVPVTRVAYDPAHPRLIDDDGDGIDDRFDNCSGRGNPGQETTPDGSRGLACAVDCGENWAGINPPMGVAPTGFYPCVNETGDDRFALARAGDGSTLFAPDMPQTNPDGSIQLHPGATLWVHSTAVGPNVQRLPSPTFTTPANSASSFGVRPMSLLSPEGTPGTLTVRYQKVADDGTLVPVTALFDQDGEQWTMTVTEGDLPPVEMRFDKAATDFIMMENGDPNVVGALAASSATVAEFWNGGERLPLPVVVPPTATAMASASPAPSASASPTPPPTPPASATPPASVVPTPTATAFPSPTDVVRPTPPVSAPTSKPTPAATESTGGNDSGGCASSTPESVFATMSALLALALARRKKEEKVAA